MLTTIFGLLIILIGVIWFIYTYKNRNKLYDIEHFYPNDKYEVVEKEKLLKIQKIFILSYTVYCITLGVLGLFFGSGIYMLGLLSTSFYPIFVLISKKYVKPRF